MNSEQIEAQASAHHESLKAAPSMFPKRYKCPKCGTDNQIVNQCGCDPNNLPTRPLDKWKPIERFNYIGEGGGLCRLRRVGDCEPIGKMADAETAARVVLCWNTLKDLGASPHLAIGELCVCMGELVRALRSPGDHHEAEIGRAMKALAAVGYVKPLAGKGG